MVSAEPLVRPKPPAWRRLEELAHGPLPTILAHVAGGGGPRFELDGLFFELSRLGIPEPVWQALDELARATGVAEFRDRMARGEVVNPSEGRAATHMALRAPDGRAGLGPMAQVADWLRSGRFDHVLHLGIGGSALGPALLIDALGRDGDGPEVRVVANVDGEAFHRACHGCRPQRTAVIVVSKTFTTVETRLNLRSALAWLAAGGVEDPMGQVVAVTAAAERAVEAGVQSLRILEFAPSVGGRFSLWSAVGLPFAVRCGMAAFTALLDGAAAMDRHFLTTPWQRNVPMRAAAADLWFAAILGRPTRAVFAYDERLRWLVPYLQQLEMESNGKGVASDGARLAWPTAPVTWGGTGTDAQHAVFQLLHQGTHQDPVEFVAVAQPGHPLAPEHHRQLLANCLAQGAALAAGRGFAEALAASGGDPAVAAQRVLPGNRPSATILIDRLVPDRLGALLAFYEARTVSLAAMLGVNPFDQWGVELGKELAAALGRGEDLTDPVTQALQDFIRRAQAKAA